jgi:hypothetical protein
VTELPQFYFLDFLLGHSSCSIDCRCWRIFPNLSDKFLAVSPTTCPDEIAKQPAYIKDYRVRDLQVIAGCFEKAKEVSMKDFVDTFDDQLTREQVRYIVSKLEDDKLIERSGGGRSIKYNLKNTRTGKSVFEYLITEISK